MIDDSETHIKPIGSNDLFITLNVANRPLKAMASSIVFRELKIVGAKGQQPDRQLLDAGRVNDAKRCRRCDTEHGARRPPRRSRASRVIRQLHCQQCNCRSSGFRGRFRSAQPFHCQLLDNVDRAQVCEDPIDCSALTSGDVDSPWLESLCGQMSPCEAFDPSPVRLVGRRRPASKCRTVAQTAAHRSLQLLAFRNWAVRDGAVI